MSHQNLLKQKIKQGLPVIGTWNTLASPLVTELLSRSGLDFLILDLEHGPFDLGQLHVFINACQHYQCTPIVRIPTLSEYAILQALDQGTHGVMIPHIENQQEAQRLINAMKYFPEGQRGYSPFTKYGGFAANNPKEFALEANAFTLTSVLIESLEGLKNLDSILEVNGIDIVYFGSFDLSQALGVPGEPRHPKVVETIAAAADKVVKAGKYAGGFVAQKEEDIDWLLKLGLKFITYDVDSAFLMAQYKKVVTHFKRSTGNG